PETWIGAKRLFSGKSTRGGEPGPSASGAAAPDGKMLTRSGLRWDLLRVENRYQWYRQDNYWRYEPVKSTKRIADGRIDVAADKPGRIAVPMTWGRYRLEGSTHDPHPPVTTRPFP